MCVFTDVMKPILMAQTVNIPLQDKASRLHVCGEVLERRDFRTLKDPNWLNDKVCKYTCVCYTFNTIQNITQGTVLLSSGEG